MKTPSQKSGQRTAEYRIASISTMGIHQRGSWCRGQCLTSKRVGSAAGSPIRRISMSLAW
ncbi:hypothetical protein FB004_1384 [Sinorhizobium medicae]|nr:hypothetical protein FB006_16212 [Sinorhizobium medicae]TWA12784.1 hypothetical protein FB004_1384 [Sinorhizobium medicae]TWA22254.1 hypothetical protein FB007_16014 [Sinorhizobium medicae]TWA31100.1 hypothetical protein FB009_13913 [Sinorhizobium medicae]TWA32772.1 hypothetical protein FB005_1594 [Sinorhizobium medicae]